MIRALFVLVPVALLLALAACPTQPPGDDDTSTIDDDDIYADDDDSGAPDDDDSASDDDDDDACADDALEENDDEASAATVTAGDYPDLVACPDEEDWYRVDLETGQRLDVGLSFVHADGDIDFRIHDLYGDQVASGTSIDDDEAAFAVAQEAGPFHVVVYTIDDLGSDYAMSVAIGDAPDCPEDPLEDNDSSAAPATLGEGSWTELTVCKDDEDWYRFGLTAGQVLDLTVSFTSDLGDIDLELYDAAGVMVGDSGTVEDVEQISFTATDAGDYDLRVFIWEWDENWQNVYDLGVTIQ